MGMPPSNWPAALALTVGIVRGKGARELRMQASEVPRALAAAMSIAAALDLAADQAIVLHDSNRLAVRLLPCDVLARVAHAPDRAAPFEVELAQRLAEMDSPVGALEPRVEPLVYERDGYAVTLWTYYEPLSPVSAPGYASALQRLHVGMQSLDRAAPHFTDRVVEARRIVADIEHSPPFAKADGDLLGDMLRSQEQAVRGYGAAEQLLHGEPHPGNLLSTRDGPLFIDIETCCRGPVEFDLAHVPDEISRCYPGADRGLLGECRGLMLAMVAAWRWDPDDQLPNGEQAARDLLYALHAGPPWPTLDSLTPPG